MKQSHQLVVALCLLVAVVSVFLGVAWGRDTAPKYQITRINNGTLDVYNSISIYSQLPSDLESVYKVENKDRIVFLWNDQTNREYCTLKIMVVDK